MTVYPRDSIGFSVIDTDVDIEQLFLLFTVNNYKIAMGCVYKPPNLYYKNFVESLEDTIVNIIPICDRIVCCGDFIIDYLKISDTYCNNILERFFDFLGFSQFISEPTRISLNLHSLIDLLFVSEVTMITASGTLDCPFSDHEFIIFQLQV